MEANQAQLNAAKRQVEWAKVRLPGLCEARNTFKMCPPVRRLIQQSVDWHATDDDLF